jgi:hypothetical protein
VLEEFDFGTGSLELIGTGFIHRVEKTTSFVIPAFFGQHLTLCTMAGFSEYDRTDNSDRDKFAVPIDSRDDAPVPFPTPWVNFLTGVSVDEREMFRLDGEWDLDRHLQRFGLD